MMKTDLVNRTNAQLSDLYQVIINMLPKILGAVLLTVLGFFIAKLVRYFILRLTRGVDYIYNAYRNQAVKRKYSFANFFADIGFWLIFLLFIAASIQLLEIPEVHSAIHQLVYYLPNIFLAAVIIFIGYVISDPISYRVFRWLQSRGILFYKQISTFTQIIIIILSSLVGISQLGIDVKLINYLIISFFTSIFFAFMFSCSVSLIPYIQHMISIFYVKKMYELGQNIEFDHHLGNIKSYTQTSVIISTKKGELVVPGKEFFDQVVTTRKGTS